jgi:Na+-transporting NADH:ubiquinone oxidoreductase subunit NqrE
MIFKSGLLQAIVLLKGHVMKFKKCDHYIKVKVKLKTKIGKSKYSVSVVRRMSNAVNKASYLEIFCCNALSTCTKVADLLFLNYVVKKFRKSPRN